MYKSYTVIEDNGDGSQSVRYFSSEEAAQKFIDNYEAFGGPEPDGVEVDHFEITAGDVLKPLYGFDDV